MNKFIPKNAKLYCPYCMIETEVHEGELKHPEYILPLFCSVCRKQISEFIFENGSWRLNRGFYRRGLMHE